MTGRDISAALMRKLQALAEVPLRFPVPLACAALWATITIARNHDLDTLGWQTVERIQVFLLLGLFLSLSVKLLAESHDLTATRWLPLSAAALGLLALIVFVGQPAEDTYGSPIFLFMGPGMVLLTIVSPFLRRRAEGRAIWDFNFKSWTSAAFGLLVALVLALGMAAVLGALETLFGVDIPGNYYGDVWIISLSLIWPWQTLAGVPGGFGATGEEYCPTWIRYVLSWLLVPLALLYLALLYAFAVKIVVQWTLPHGQVGWLVGGFAAFGLAVWHAAHPLRETGNRLGRLYVRFFHPALFVPVALLAVGVGTRIAEYGVTENRYGLALLTLWLAGIAVHGAVVRAPRLNVAPVSLAALLVLATFGPWGASAISLNSQLARLDALLAEAGILRDGRLSAPAMPVGGELAKRVSSVVDYLDSPGKRQALVDLLRNGGIDLAVDSRPVDIATALGVEYINRWGNPEYQSWSRPDPRELDTRGFDRVIWMYVGPEGQWGISAEADDTATTAWARTAGGKLEITAQGRGPTVIDLVPVVETLKRDGKPGYNHDVNDRLMVAETAGNGLRVRVYFTTIDIAGPPEAMKVQRLAFIALIGPDREE